MQADDRRLAELHYKASLTLQYLDQPEEALREIKVSCPDTAVISLSAGCSVWSRREPYAHSHGQAYRTWSSLFDICLQLE